MRVKKNKTRKDERKNEHMPIVRRREMKGNERRKEMVFLDLYKEN